MMKKFMSSIITVILLICSSLPASASPQKSDEDKLSGFVSSNAISVMNTETAPSSIIEFIKKNKVSLNSDSIIQLIPAESKNTKSKITALSIINKDGNTITNDVLINPINNDNQNTLTQSSSVIQPNAGTGVDYNLDSRFTVHGVAVYNKYYSGIFSYYSPYGSYFYCYKNSPVEISYISVDYICDGITYTYPGFSYIGDEVEHHVDASSSYPIEGTMYSNTNYFDSDKVLSVSSGSLSVGNFLIFTYTADGESDSYGVKL